MMNENIWSIFLLDKTKSFLVVKPFDDTFCHDDILLSMDYSGF